MSRESKAISLRELAQLVECSFEGDGELILRGIAPLSLAKADEVSFLANPKYASQLVDSQAGCVIVSEHVAARLNRTLLISPNPYYTFALVSQHFAPSVPVTQGVSPQAAVADDVTLGEGVSIMPFVYLAPGVSVGHRTILYPGVYVGHDSRIGDDCIVYPQVMIRERVTIGDRVIIHSGTVIGTDGFGFATDRGVHHKVPQVGTVVIEDDVELGAGMTIDRGTLGETRIGKGTKFDDQVHIAHNVTIGENCLIVAQVGVSGSTAIGSSVTIAGQAGLAGHLTVGNNVTIGARAAVLKPVPDGKIVSGIIPARDHAKASKATAALFRLPELIKKVARLERELNQLRKQLSGDLDHE